jgi:hypothetical protein
MMAPRKPKIQGGPDVIQPYTQHEQSTMGEGDH